MEVFRTMTEVRSGKLKPRTLSTYEQLLDIYLSAGYNHALAIDNYNMVWTWGDNSSGQLGNGTTTNSLEPHKISMLNDITQIEAGLSHSIALNADGTVWAWGKNSSGQLGNGTTNDVNYPVQVIMNQ